MTEIILKQSKLLFCLGLGSLDNSQSDIDISKFKLFIMVISSLLRSKNLQVIIIIML